MKIEIEIPDLLESDYDKDKLSSFFSKVIRDIKKLGNLCGIHEEEMAETLKAAFINSQTVSQTNTVDSDTFAIIERAKTLLTAYRDMFDRSETEDRFYGKTLPELTVVYDDAECDASCLYDDMGSLLDDIEDLGLYPEKMQTEVMR